MSYHLQAVFRPTSERKAGKGKKKVRVVPQKWLANRIMENNDELDLTDANSLVEQVHTKIFGLVALVAASRQKMRTTCALADSKPDELFSVFPFGDTPIAKTQAYFCKNATTRLLKEEGQTHPEGAPLHVYCLLPLIAALLLCCPAALLLYSERVRHVGGSRSSGR